MSKIISQEAINISCGIIHIHNHTKCIGVPLRGFGACKPNDIITDYTCRFINWLFLNNIVFHIVLCSGNKESMLTVKVTEELLKPKSVIRDSFLLFLMTAIRKFQSYLSDCQQFTIFTTQKKSYSYDA